MSSHRHRGHALAGNLRYLRQERGMLFVKGPRGLEIFFNTEKEVVTETEGNVTNRLIHGSRLIVRVADVDRSRAYCRYAADKLGSIKHLTGQGRKVVRSISYHLIMKIDH